MTADLQFLDSYTGQSTEELIALAGTHRVDSIVLAFEESLQFKDTLTSVERTIVAIEALEREVNNGGFSQFFSNPSRDYAPYIVDALEAIGCPKTAALCNEAMSILGVTDQTSTDEIEDLACDASEDQDQRLSALDDIYYQGAEEPISEKLFEYIKRNRSEISPVAP